MRPSTRRFLELAGPPAFFLGLAAAVTWPLVIHLPDRIPGWYIADNYEYLWKIWWFRRALLELHVDPLFAPHILFPNGFPLAYAEITPLHTILALPLTAVVGEVVSYNISALSSFVLAGWAAYLVVNRWTGSPWAGILSGALFILNPYHVVRYGGILPLMAIEGIPVFVLGIERWLTCRRLSWIGLAALGYMLTAWASIYYAFGLLILGPLYLAIRLAAERQSLTERRALFHLSMLVLSVIVVTVPLAIPYLNLRNSSTLVIPLQESDYWSASLTDFLVPPGLHPLWGAWTMENLLGVPREYPQIALEFVLAPGYVALLFATYGAFKSQAKAKRAVLWLGAVALLLSFGPTLHIGRQPIVIPAPEPTIMAFNQFMERLGSALPAHKSYAPLSSDGLRFPLPALLLRWLVVPLTGLRAWNRFSAFASLGISFLAGLGLAVWIDTEVRPRSAALNASFAILAFILLALLELWPVQIPLQTIAPRPVDTWLAARPEQGSIMELPLTSALSAPQMLYTRYHGRPITFAYGTFLPYWFRQQYPELQACPGDACLARLRSWGVVFLLLNTADATVDPQLEAELDRSPSLSRLASVGSHVVYKVLD